MCAFSSPTKTALDGTGSNEHRLIWRERLECADGLIREGKAQEEEEEEGKAVESSGKKNGADETDRIRGFLFWESFVVAGVLCVGKVGGGYCSGFCSFLIFYLYRY